MKTILNAPASSVIPDDPGTLWIKKRSAIWMLTLFEYEIKFTDNFFYCLGWILGGNSVLVDRLQKDLKLPSGNSKKYAEAKKELKDLNHYSGRHLMHQLEHFFEYNIYLNGQMRNLCYSWLHECARISARKTRTIFPRGFQALFNLDQTCLDLCTYAWGLENHNPMEAWFEDDLELHKASQTPLMARMLGISTSVLKKSRTFLSSLGLLDDDVHMMRLTDNVGAVLNAGGMGKVQNFFCKNLPATEVPLEQFRVAGDEKEHVLKLFKYRGSNPVHVLLYGAPGTGKTSFASCIASCLGVDAWSVACNERDSVKDRRVSLTACMNLASLHPGSIVVIDEAERLLDTDVFDTDHGSSKAWLNDLLEKKNLRFIWITNKIQHIDQAVRRRFSFSIHFETPGTAECVQMWSNVAQRLKVEDYFPLSTREHFAREYRVPVAVMENVTRQAKAISTKKGFCDCAERILKSHMQLQNDGYWRPNKTNSNPDWEPAAIAINEPVDVLLGKLSKLHALLAKQPAPCHGNLLFYGPPGTGKTSFGRYIAKTLDMELHAIRASDLIDPYVGETEKNIARAFATASENKSLLLIDEVDSFLFGRENAQRSWEQTMVNEFLTNLENFNGICICTTNFRTIIDSAAMRRFPYKIEFAYVGANQIQILYNTILGPLCAQKPTEKELELLCSQKFLAPGDFYAVRTRFWLEDEGTLTPEKLIAALLHEQRLKLEKESKQLGF